jgi:hypothetical protein
MERETGRTGDSSDGRLGRFLVASANKRNGRALVSSTQAAQGEPARADGTANGQRGDSRHVNGVAEHVCDGLAARLAQNVVETGRLLQLILQVALIRSAGRKNGLGSAQLVAFEPSNNHAVKQSRARPISKSAPGRIQPECKQCPVTKTTQVSARTQWIPAMC